MPYPSMIILGVYIPKIERAIWREEWKINGDKDLTDAHFMRLVLLEGTVENLTEPLNMAKFGQVLPEGPIYPGGPTYPSHMQVGYDEGLLSSDGETLIRRSMQCVKGDGQLRFAVYLHYYDPTRSLQWEFGEVSCPGIQDAPRRLRVLMPYRVPS